MAAATNGNETPVSPGTTGKSCRRYFESSYSLHIRVKQSEEGVGEAQCWRHDVPDYQDDPLQGSEIFSLPNLPGGLGPEQ